MCSSTRIQYQNARKFYTQKKLLSFLKGFSVSELCKHQPWFSAWNSQISLAWSIEKILNIIQHLRQKIAPISKRCARWPEIHIRHTNLCNQVLSRYFLLQLMKIMILRLLASFTISVSAVPGNLIQFIGFQSKYKMSVA